jgi:prepilin-type N-terminal cleavage/methylation domain-containing protein
MKRRARTNGLPKHSPQAGSTLIETMIAIAIILICAAGVLGLAALSVTTTENQGHLMARTTEYSQDKMEQLLALAYCDATTDTTKIPSVPTGGTGLAGCPNPPLTPATGTGGIGGSSDPSSPATNYVDYLDSTGTPVTGTGGWTYIRVWQIAAGPGGLTQMKQITVTTRVNNSVGSRGLLPQSTVTVLKSYPF